MEAHLSIITCEKCGEPMEKVQPVLVVAEGEITEAAEEDLTFLGSCVRYACHLSCWDSVGGSE